MTTSTERIWAELKQVVDPCSAQLGRPMDIVSMGLVEDVSVLGDAVEIELLLTDANCIFFFKFADEIETRLAVLDGVEHVEVRLNEGRMWTPDRMAAGAPEAPSL